MADIALPDLVGRIRIDSSNLDGIDRQAKGVSSNISGHFKKMALSIGAAIGTIQIGQFLKGAISEASDLEESMAKVGVVFGDSADSVKAFAETSASTLGLSKNQALAATGTFGNLFRALELGEKDSSNMAVSLTTLAGDLASFNNVNPEEALLALRSGLVGETEPLKRFGVNMNEATLRAQAFKLGLIKSEKEALTPSIKAQSAYALIMEQTALAQGDFARTSDGLANRQRILTARFADLKGQIGTKLLPVVIEIAEFIGKSVLPAFEKFGKLIGTLAKGDLADIGAALKELVPRLRELAAGVISFIRANPGPAFAALGVVLVAVLIPALTAFIGLLVGLVAALLSPVVILAAFAAAVVYAYQNFETFRNVVDTVVSFMVNKFNEVKGFVLEVWPAISKAIGTAINVAAENVKAALGTIMAWWNVFGDDVKTVVGGIFQVIKAIVETAVNVIAGIIRVVLAVITGDWGKAWAALRSTVDAASRGVEQAMNGLLNILKGLVGGFFDAAVRMGGAILEGISKGVSGAVGLVTDVGKAVANGIIGFVNSNVIDKINRSLEFRIDVLGQGVDINPPNISHIPKFHSGGIVQGSPGQDVLALLKAGERVIPVGGVGQSAGQTINVALSGSNLNPFDVSREIAWQLKVTP